MPEALREASLVFAREVRRAAVGVRGLFLAGLYVLGAGAGAAIFVAIAGTALRFTGAVGGEEGAARARQAVFAWLFSGDPATARHLAAEPLLPLFCFWGASLFVPFAVLLFGFDAVAGEASAGTLRYLTLRCRRGALLAGKLAAQLLVASFLTAVAFAAVEAYAAWHLGPPPPGELAALGRYFLLSLPLLFVDVALVALCSTLVRSPGAALMAAAFAFAALWIARVFFGRLFPPFAWATPAFWQPWLLSPEPARFLPGLAALAGFAALFASAAWLALRTRDL